MRTVRAYRPSREALPVLLDEEAEEKRVRSIEKQKEKALKEKHRVEKMHDITEIILNHGNIDMISGYVQKRKSVSEQNKRNNKRS